MTNDITWEAYRHQRSAEANRLLSELYGLEEKVRRMERVVAEARNVAGLRSGAWPRLAQALADLDGVPA